MTDFSKYDFGYSWYVSYGHLVPLALSGELGALAVWRGWPRWVPVLAGVVAVWAVAGLFITHVVFRINLPVEPPTSAPATCATCHSRTASSMPLSA